MTLVLQARRCARCFLCVYFLSLHPTVAWRRHACSFFYVCLGTQRAPTTPQLATTATAAMLISGAAGVKERDAVVFSGAAAVKKACVRHPPPSRLQNVRPVNYGEDSTELFVNLTCPPDYVGRVEASCPGTNATVAMNCSGMYPTIDPLTGVALSFENTWTTQMSCATTVQPTCLLWNAALQAYDDQLCRPVNWTATNTTCACGADASAVASEGGGASFTSGAAALAGYFASMFDPSAFGANLFMQASYGVLHEDRISLQLRRNLLFAQNPLLMATFGTILSLVLLNMARAVVSFSSLFPNFLPIFLPAVIFISIYFPSLSLSP